MIRRQMNMTALYNSRRSLWKNRRTKHNRFRAGQESAAEVLFLLSFFSHSFRPLAIANQLGHEVWLRAGILGVLVAKELGDAAR